MDRAVELVPALDPAADLDLAVELEREPGQAVKRAQALERVAELELALGLAAALERTQEVPALPE